MMAAGTAFATATVAPRAPAQTGFMAASAHVPDAPGGQEKMGPGLQGISARCELTGGGGKVYGIAIEYDAAIAPDSVALETYAASVFPAAKGFFPGMPQEPDKNAATEAAKLRQVVAVYANSHAALRTDRTSVAGRFVIAEFGHDSDLSLPANVSLEHQA